MFAARPALCGPEHLARTRYNCAQIFAADCATRRRRIADSHNWRDNLPKIDNQADDQKNFATVLISC